MLWDTTLSVIRVLITNEHRKQETHRSQSSRKSRIPTSHFGGGKGLCAWLHWYRISLKAWKRVHYLWSASRDPRIFLDHWRRKCPSPELDTICDIDGEEPSGFDDHHPYPNGVRIFCQLQWCLLGMHIQCHYSRNQSPIALTTSNLQCSALSAFVQVMSTHGIYYKHRATPRSRGEMVSKSPHAFDR